MFLVKIRTHFGYLNKSLMVAYPTLSFDFTIVRTKFASLYSANWYEIIYFYYFNRPNMK